MRAVAVVPDTGWNTSEASLHDLYRSERTSLVRLAVLLLSDTSDAEEVVQDAFVKAYLAWNRLRDPARALPFLRSAVLNGARSRLRREKISGRLRAVEAVATPAAEAAALASVRRDEVVALLSRLPTRQRECVVLRFYLGLNEAEIAATLGIANGSVKTHIHRGLARLAESLESIR